MAQLMPLIEGVLLPLLTASILFAIFHRFSDRLGSALAIAGGFLIAQIALTSVPEFPPIDAAQWVFYAVPVALIALAIPMNPLVRISFRALISAAMLAGILKTMIEYTWTTSASLLWMISLTILATATWQALQAAVDRDSSSRFVRWYLVAAVSLLALMLAMSGSLMLAQLAGALAASLGPLALVPKGRTHLSDSFVAVIAVVYIGLTTAGFFYAEMPGLSAFFLLVVLALPLLYDRIVSNPATPHPLVHLGLVAAIPVLGAMIPVTLRLIESI